jgi:hypothetical protein
MLIATMFKLAKLGSKPNAHQRRSGKETVGYSHNKMLYSSQNG